LTPVLRVSDPGSFATQPIKLALATEGNANPASGGAVAGASYTLQLSVALCSKPPVHLDDSALEFEGVAASLTKTLDLSKIFGMAAG
jgi:hypothetical protein